MSQHDEVGSTPPVSIAVIETDTFCERCGFNLHTQRVWRDGRLGILVTRCPECGAHQAAGKATSSGSAWLNRLATLGLVAWILLVLAFVIGATLTHVGITGSSQDSLVVDSVETLDGRPVTNDWDPKTSTYFWHVISDVNQTPLPSSAVVQRYRVVPTLTGRNVSDSAYSYRYIPFYGIVIMTTIFGAIVLSFGVIESAFTWFWRPAWRWAWLVLPIIAGAIVVSFEMSSSTHRYSYVGNTPIQSEGLGMRYIAIAVVTLLQMLVLGFGLLIGRRVARVAVSVIIPPKSRQLFAFLWHADGLAMPGRRTA